MTTKEYEKEIKERIKQLEAEKPSQNTIAYYMINDKVFAKYFANQEVHNPYFSKADYRAMKSKEKVSDRNFDRRY